MGKTITLYGQDATAFVELVHKYRLWEPPQEPKPWNDETVVWVAKRLTDKQKEAVLMLEGVKRREWMSSRGSNQRGTRTLSDVEAKPEPMVYINGRVCATLDHYGITRHWYENDKQTALTTRGIQILEYLKAQNDANSTD